MAEDLVEALLLGQQLHCQDYGLESHANAYAIATPSHVLAAWDLEARRAGQRRILLSTGPLRRGGHAQHLRDALRVELGTASVPVVEQPQGIDPIRWRRLVWEDQAAS